ncbi:ficolin-3-like [Sabethes cyaneus]|uniref:ficolin-3-like n=1 Tax=Sabethes cyaneus TaxID=53552 RepID=UPI00237DA2D2|nr:ficolin-3-like [Sabethes cyaneus]
MIRALLVTCSEAPSQSGIYWISPTSGGAPFQVFCEQEKYAGGWLVFQNRNDGFTGFNRSWNDYKYGFGDLRQNFWLGLEKLHRITNAGTFDMMVVLENFHDFMAFQKYENFRIGSEAEQYSLDISGVNDGTAGESLLIYKGEKFSTYDRDNDGTSINCASELGGGYWHYDCRSSVRTSSFLNGLYSEKAMDDGSGIWWGGFGGVRKPLKKTRMMIKPHT